jgi:hypothetical protein
MALHTYSKLHDDPYTTQLFRELTLRLIQLQGPQGEWAWFYDTVTGKVTDWYQVYSVHQEAMAMLFLLPALDDGLQEAKAAIERSYRWLFGDNQLNVPMMTKEPFFSYRSIRRKETMESARRILRSAAVSGLGSHAKLASNNRVEINPECRSYEMGWTVFVWANRNDFEEFLDLQLL